MDEWKVQQTLGKYQMAKQLQMFTVMCERCWRIALSLPFTVEASLSGASLFSISTIWFNLFFSTDSCAIVRLSNLDSGEDKQIIGFIPPTTVIYIFKLFFKQKKGNLKREHDAACHSWYQAPVLVLYFFGHQKNRWTIFVLTLWLPKINADFNLFSI